MTVMSLRSVALSALVFGSGGPASAEPQLVQKRCPATIRAEQVGQTGGRAEPQLPQKRAVASASALQLGQVRALLGQHLIVSWRVEAPSRQHQHWSCIDHMLSW